MISSPAGPSILIDTSTLRGTGWRTAPFQSLLELSKVGLVEIVVPELVLEERRTQWRDKHAGKIRDCAAALQALAADEIVPQAHAAKVKAALQSLLELDLDAASKEGFASLFKSNDIKTIPLSIAQAKAAWEHYFAGSGPLQKPKNRDDIPDAHIFAAAREVLEEKNELHCVCADGALGEALGDIKGITLHPSVEELLKDPVIARARRLWEAEKEWLLIAPTMSYGDLRTEIVSFLETDGGNALVGDKLDSSMIPANPTTAHIDWAEGAELVEVENPDDWGGGVLSFEVRFECDVGVGFLVYPEDIHKMPHWVRVTSRRQDVLADAEATLRLYVEGTVSAQVDLAKAKLGQAPFLTGLSLSIYEKSVQETL